MTTEIVVRRWTALLCAAVLGLAACGSGGESESEETGPARAVDGDAAPAEDVDIDVDAVDGVVDDAEGETASE